jgi:hypothetical protein
MLIEVETLQRAKGKKFVLFVTNIWNDLLLQMPFNTTVGITDFCNLFLHICSKIIKIKKVKFKIKRSHLFVWFLYFFAEATKKFVLWKMALIIDNFFDVDEC